MSSCVLLTQHTEAKTHKLVRTSTHSENHWVSPFLPPGWPLSCIVQLWNLILFPPLDSGYVYTADTTGTNLFFCLFGFVFFMTLWTAQITLDLIFSIVIRANFICGLKSDSDVLQCDLSLNSHFRIHVTFTSFTCLNWVSVLAWLLWRGADRWSQMYPLTSWRMISMKPSCLHPLTPPYRSSSHCSTTSLN